MKRLLIFLCLLLAACTLDLKPVRMEDLRSDSITVSVEGEVEHPGTVQMNLYDTVDDLLNEVSLTEDADLTSLNRQMMLKDRDVIVIPEKHEKENPVVSVNNAGAEELTSLPGIGKSTAEKIIAYRTENGRFQTIEDLLNVSGIGEAKLEKIREFISL
jgi:competence protein ComEA